jgi:hypothetical protein
MSFSSNYFVVSIVVRIILLRLRGVSECFIRNSTNTVTSVRVRMSPALFKTQSAKKSETSESGTYRRSSIVLARLVYRYWSIIGLVLSSAAGARNATFCASNVRPCKSWDCCRHTVHHRKPCRPFCASSCGGVVNRRAIPDRVSKRSNLLRGSNNQRRFWSWRLASKCSWWKAASER